MKTTEQPDRVRDRGTPAKKWTKKVTNKNIRRAGKQDPETPIKKKFNRGYNW